MHIRHMSINDLDFALDLIMLEGWTGTRQNLEELLRYDPKGSFIGEIDGKPMSMVCTVNYGEFGFIGNLIVQQLFRGQNFGKYLMEFAMKYLLDNGTNSLLVDGVPKALSLYEKLGFRKIAKSLRLEAILTGSETKYTRQMTESDLSKIDVLDSRYFGGSREEFLRMRFVANPGLSKVIEIDGDLQGFIMGSHRRNSVRIGPMVVDGHSRSAEHLLAELSGKSEETIHKIGVLETNIHALKLLKQYGFKETSYSWRMVYGRDTEATLSNHLYAIGGPDRG